MNEWYLLYNDKNELVYKTNRVELIDKYIKNDTDPDLCFEDILVNDDYVLYDNGWYIKVINL